MDLLIPTLASEWVISPLIESAAQQPFWFIGGAIALTAIIVEGIKAIIRTGTRERSRREIAAYIAEGSMTPEQGERLMKADPKQEC